MENRIFCLANSFWNTGLSGGDVRFVEIAKVMAERNFRLYVLTSKIASNLFKENGLNKVDYVITPKIFDKLGIYISYILRTFYAIFWILFHKKPDAFYSISDFFPDVIPAFLFKTKKNQWIQVIHHLYQSPLKRKGNFIVNLIGFLFQNFSLHFIKMKATKIIVVNRILQSELIIKKKFSSEKIFVSSNGLNLSEFENIPVAISEKTYDGVMVARLAPNKGVLDLPLIWKLVREKRKEAKLALIGGWGFENFKVEVEKAIYENGEKGFIDILGFIPRERVLSILKSSKVFVFPSYEEGWGISIAEAMACELPVVAWDLPIYCYVFENQIIQVKKGNYKEMANKILDLLDNEEKRKAIAKKGKEFIKRYDWKKVAEKEIEIISN